MAEQLGRYTLEKRIGAGGMADVFLARGPSGTCVLKRPHPHLCNNPDFVRMFLDEASLVAQLNHRGIAHVFDLGQVGGVYFLAMEYVPGFDLMTISLEHERQGEFMAFDLAAQVVSDIAAALHHAHEAKNARGQPMNIIHRDVTPHNILLSTSGEVKLIDFGVAKAANTMHRTQAGLVKGKYPYMSPEQITGQKIDRRVDIYAMGLVLYELLTNTRAIAGELEVEQIENARYGRIRPIEQVRPNVPEVLRRILAGCLANDPNQRYPTGAALQTDLQMFLRTEGHVVTRDDLLRLFRVVAAEAMHSIPQLEAGPPVVASKPGDDTYAPDRKTELEMSQSGGGGFRPTEPHVPSNPSFVAAAPFITSTPDRPGPEAFAPTAPSMPSVKSAPLPSRIAGDVPPPSRPPEPPRAGLERTTAPETPQPQRSPTPAVPADDNLPTLPPDPKKGIGAGVIGLLVVALLVAGGAVAWKLGVFSPSPVVETPPEKPQPEVVVVPPPEPQKPDVVDPQPSGVGGGTEAVAVEPTQPDKPTQPDQPAVPKKPAQLRAISNLAGVSISIDKKSLGKAPYEGEWPAGRHTVTFSSSEPRVTHSESVTVRAGETRTIEWTPQKAKLVINALPMTTVKLDGADTGKNSAYHELELWEGTHQLELSGFGKSKKLTVTLKPGATEKVSVNWNTEP